MHLALLSAPVLLAAGALGSVAHLQRRDFETVQKLVNEFDADLNKLPELCNMTVSQAEYQRQIETDETLGAKCKALGNSQKDYIDNVYAKSFGFEVEGSVAMDDVYSHLIYMGGCLYTFDPEQYKTQLACFKESCDERAPGWDPKKLEEYARERTEIAKKHCPKIASEFKKIVEEGYVATLPNLSLGTTTSGTETWVTYVTSGVISQTYTARTYPESAWASVTSAFGGAEPTGDAKPTKPAGNSTEEDPKPTPKPESAASHWEGSGRVWVASFVFAMVGIFAL